MMLKRLMLSLTVFMAVFFFVQASPNEAYAEGYGADGHYYSDADVEAIIDATWDAEAAPVAKTIAYRESGYVPQAVNTWDGDAFCLFQITDIVEVEYGISEYDLDTPYECSAFAYQLYLDQGWGPWSLTYY
jgi:hypothetical protein